MEDAELVCPRCGYRRKADLWSWICPRCGTPLQVEVSPKGSISWDKWRRRKLGVWRYRELLPRPRRIVSLGEGGTPLVKADSISRSLWVKFEGANPTGSFKDRGMTVGVSLALEAGARIVGAASTGNTSASLAAYASRAGLASIVVLPQGKVAPGKLFQAILHGAKIVEIEGSFDNALDALVKAAEHRIVYPLNSYNPWRLEGQKTIAYEIADEIGVPDYVVAPVGNAGNISAIWKGFKELLEHGLIDSVPRLIGIQAEGASPLYRTWSTGSENLQPVAEPETVATAIRIGRPVNWFKALKAVHESKGFLEAVSDKDILEAQKLIARRIGLGVEPASAAPLAGYLKLVEKGVIDKNSRVVLVATGHALKDPGIADLVDSESIRAGSVDEAVEIISSLARSLDE